MFTTQSFPISVFGSKKETDVEAMDLRDWRDTEMGSGDTTTFFFFLCGVDGILQRN